MCSLTPLKIEDFVNYRFLSGLEANPSQTARPLSVHRLIWKKIVITEI